ncbi:MAG: hypothetical protein KGJ79_09945 [Alphaproteobacteria bacterium]|nr:hypothetical protein [Alphaproteobacteria bacterium]MDE2494203.1 hypothetical protein [Alphaproteobacteria bacterium]
MNNLSKRPVLRRKKKGGAPKGNRNAFKTGAHTAEVRALQRRVRDLKLRCRLVLAQFDT